jgi:DNA-binding LacI/PurR family transcriptional regulator
MNSGPLFVRVAEGIKENIRKGSIVIGGYLPSVRQLQQDYDVSKNTIISALRSLQHDGIIAREGAARHGFRVIGEPAETNGFFSADEASIYKMIMPFSFWNYAGSKLLEVIESVFSREHIGLLFGNHGNDVNQERELLDRFLHRHHHAVDALILMTARSYENPNADLLRQIRQQMPVLYLDRRVREVPGHVVGIDNRQIGATAAELFLSKGYRSFGFLTGLWHVSSVRDRYGGFVTRLAEAGLSVDQRYFFPLDNVYAMDLPLENAWDAMGERLSRVTDLPEAFFCASDKAAGALIRFCESRGIRVPGEVAIIGCDADEFVAPKIDRKITSFAYPFSDISQELERMLRSIRQEGASDASGRYRSVEITPSFVPGETD